MSPHSEHRIKKKLKCSKIIVNNNGKKNLKRELNNFFPTIKANTSDLIPYARNSRTHSDEQINQICSSIKEFGFTNPIIIDEDSGIIAGHGRVMAANKLKIEEVPCVQVTGWTEAQKKAYVIADNKLALNAGWDMEMLKVEFQELQELDLDLDLTGFSADELADLFPTEVEEGLTDEDAVPDAPEQPVTIEGDIWTLGEHRLMCGDSTDAGSVALLMDGQKADMLLTEPPYNVAYVGKTKDALKIKNDSMSNDSFREFLQKAFNCAKETLRDGGAFYIWHADSEGYNFRGACFDVGLQVRQCLIWNKNSMVLGRQDYHWKHEPCLYGWKDGAAHTWNTDRKQTTVLEFDRPTKSEDHPTMKPIALVEYQIANSSKPGESVLDLFGGSGSTLIAAHKTGRKCYGMELDPKYVDVIIKRWQDYTGKEAVHENSKTFAELEQERA